VDRPRHSTIFFKLFELLERATIGFKHPRGTNVRHLVIAMESVMAFPRVGGLPGGPGRAGERSTSVDESTYAGA